MTNWDSTKDRPYKNAGTRLAVWLANKRAEVPQHTISKKLGITPQTFSRYVTGRGRPDILIALHLQQITNGAVKAEHWYADEVRQARKLGFALFAEV